MDRYEKLWREHWRETHVPDANGEFYFDRQSRAERDEPSSSNLNEESQTNGS